MKTTEEILKEKEELKKQLEDKRIEGMDYNKKIDELERQLTKIKDNESIGSNIKVIKICFIIITAILCLYTVIFAATWFSSLSYSDSYDEWGDGESVEYSDDEKVFEDE